jgi:hypothetical protein
MYLSLLFRSKKGQQFLVTSFDPRLVFRQKPEGPTKEVFEVVTASGSGNWLPVLGPSLDRATVRLCELPIRLPYLPTTLY